MTRPRFLELLRALIDGWEVEICQLDHLDVWLRCRISPTEGYFEMQRPSGRWHTIPLGVAGHKDWRMADMGQPNTPRYA